MGGLKLGQFDRLICTLLSACILCALVSPSSSDSLFIAARGTIATLSVYPNSISTQTVIGAVLPSRQQVLVSWPTLNGDLAYMTFNYTSNSTFATSLSPYTFSVGPGDPRSAFGWESASRAIFCYDNGFFVGTLDGTDFVSGSRFPIAACAFDESRTTLWVQSSWSSSMGSFLVGFNMTRIVAGGSGDTTIGAPISLSQCITSSEGNNLLSINGDNLVVACDASQGYVDLSQPQTSWTLQMAPVFGPQNPYNLLTIPNSDRWYFPTDTGIEYWRLGLSGPSPKLAASSIGASSSASPSTDTFVINPSSATIYWLGNADASSITLNQLGSSDSAFTSTPPSISTVSVPYPASNGLITPSIQFVGIDAIANRFFVLFLTTSNVRGNFTLTSMGFGQCNAAATSCQTCISGGDLECGWCPSSNGMSGTCGTAADCTGTQWFQDRCPALNSASSLDALVTGLPFVLQIDATPFLAANASCNLRSSTSSQCVPIPVITAAEPLCGISSSTDDRLRTLAGNYTLEVWIDGSLSLPSPIPVSFLNCSALTTCKSCTSQSSSCDWCVYDGACVNYATDCSRSGPSSQRPQVTSACPVQGPTTPSSTISPPPPNSMVTVSATGLVAPPTGMSSIYTCSFSLPTLSSPIISPATYVSSTVTCSIPTPPSNTIGAGALTLQLNGHRFADNSNPFTFYDCTSPLLQTCDLCLAPANIQCGWNAATSSCQLASTNCSSNSTDCRSTCPVLTSANQTNFHTVDDIGTVVTVSGSYFTAASGAWICDFDFATAPATRVSDTSLTCTVPTFTNTAYFNATQTSYPTNLTVLFAGKAYAHPLSVNWYTCAGSSCGSCLNSGLSPKCRWDFELFTCGNAASLTTGVTECPNVQSMSDTFGHIAGALALTIVPTTTPSATLVYRCAWSGFSVSSVSTLTSNATLNGNNWECATPDVLTAIGSAPSVPVTSNFFIEAQLSGGEWKSYTAVPVVFTFYNCLSASNCSVCLASSQCVWGHYQACGPVSSPPSGDIISGHCPHLLSITPELVPVTDDVTVTVRAQYMPSVAWTSYSCLWTLTNGAFIRSAVTQVNSTAFTCPFTRTYRDLDFDTLPFSLVNGYASVADNRLDFEVYNCPEATDCAECTQIHPMCGWCNELGSCSAESTCQAAGANYNWTTTTCPYVETMVPPYASIGSSSSKSVTFTGYFTTPAAVLCLFTYPSGATSNVTATADSTSATCQLPNINETTSLTIDLGHLVADTTGGTRKRDSRVSGSYADPGFPRSTKRAVTSTFVKLVSESFTFEFFSCSVGNGTESNSCDACLSNPARDTRCGWCDYDGTCGDRYACNSSYPTFADSTSGASAPESRCPAITRVSPTTGPLSGGTVVTIEGTVFFNGTDDTACMFGNQVVKATVLDSKTLECAVPPASLLGIRKSGRSTDISVMWRGKAFTPTSVFSFTYRNADTTTKIVVGVVVGVCLFLILLVLIIFIVFFKRIKEARYRRRFLKLQEPNYATITAAQTSGIDRIVTPSDLKALASFIRLLEADTNFQIVHALGSAVQSSHSDNLARSIIFFYQSRGRALDVLLSFAAAEIRISEHEGTLFRSSSFACKLFTQYARYNGLKYLWITLGFYINQLAEFAREERTDDRDSILGPGKMEIDPDRFEDEDGIQPTQFDIRQNQYELLTRASKVLKSIFASIDNMSPQLRQFCASVKQQVSAKFPDNNADYKAVGGFLFLRLICPAMVAPQVYGLLPNNPNETSQRYFVLIAKTLQNLANETLPGTNEEFMAPINEFITKNIQSLHNWVDAVCDDTNNAPSSVATRELQVNDATINASVAFMQNILVDEWDLVSKNLSEDTVADLERTVERGAIGHKPVKTKPAPARRQR